MKLLPRLPWCLMCVRVVQEVGLSLPASPAQLSFCWNIHFLISWTILLFTQCTCSSAGKFPEPLKHFLSQAKPCRDHVHLLASKKRHISSIAEGSQNTCPWKATKMPLLVYQVYHGVQTRELSLIKNFKKFPLRCLQKSLWMGSAD